MKAIAPVLFDAFPEDAPHTREVPNRGCFNAGAPADAIKVLTPSKAPRSVALAGSLAALGLLPLVCSLLAFVFNRLTGQPNLLSGAEWASPVIVPSLIVSLASASAFYFQTSARSRWARVWRHTHRDTWAAHGGDITELWTLSIDTREEARGYAERLEDIREPLNLLDPEGDELDGARYALQRFSEASDLPALGAKAAAATHIKDPKVRKAAKEYKAMVKLQDLARNALEIEVEGASNLLAARTQAHSDAELIKRVHSL